jgi:hypothetical protein
MFFSKKETKTKETKKGKEMEKETKETKRVNNCPQECMPPAEVDRCYKRVFIEPIIEEEVIEVTTKPAWSEYVVHEPVWETSEEVFECKDALEWEEEECADGTVICYRDNGTTIVVEVKTLVEEGWVEEILHPEETKEVRCNKVVCPGYYEWQEVECE